MPNLKLNTPRVGFTGEGFKGEKALAILAVGLTIVSTALLIHVTLLQRKQLNHELAEIEKKKKKAEDEKTQTKKT